MVDLSDGGITLILCYTGLILCKMRQITHVTKNLLMQNLSQELMRMFQWNAEQHESNNPGW